MAALGENSRSGFGRRGSDSTVSSTEANNFVENQREFKVNAGTSRINLTSPSPRFQMSAEFNTCNDIKFGEHVTNIYNQCYAQDPKNAVFTMNDKEKTFKQKVIFLMSQKWCWALILLIIVSILFANMFIFLLKPTMADVNITYRSEIGLGPVSQEVNPSQMPFSRLLVTQTGDEETCLSKSECISKVRKHQRKARENSYQDIPYNFLIGGDGRVYEGRGYRYFGEVQKNSVESFFDDLGMIVAFIGNFDEKSPSDLQASVFQKFLKDSIKRQAVKEKYTTLCQEVLVMAKSQPRGLHSMLEKMENYYQLSTITSRIESGLMKVDGSIAELFSNPVEKITFSQESETCFNQADCIQIIRNLQEDQLSRGRRDININFVISPIGIYEGLGWDSKPQNQVNGKLTFDDGLSIRILADNDYLEANIFEFNEKIENLILDGKKLGKIFDGNIEHKCTIAIQPILCATMYP